MAHESLTQEDQGLRFVVPISPVSGSVGLKTVNHELERPQMDGISRQRAP